MEVEGRYEGIRDAAASGVHPGSGLIGAKPVGLAWRDGAGRDPNNSGNRISINRPTTGSLDKANVWLLLRKKDLATIRQSALKYTPCEPETLPRISHAHSFALNGAP